MYERMFVRGEEPHYVVACNKRVAIRQWRAFVEKIGRHPESVVSEKGVVHNVVKEREKVFFEESTTF